jgi:hypothetical protein
VYLVGFVAGWFLLARPRRLPDVVVPTPSARPPVAVVVPARNEAHNLPGLLGPHVAQCRPGDEIVVVDDGSTDATAAVAAGAGHWRILTRHILPNAMAPVIVQLSFLFAFAVLSEATLSFLGVGAVPPTPTWGNIMSEGRDFMREAPWIITIPGIALMITVMGLNFLGDGLRDVLDPRLRIQQ